MTEANEQKPRVRPGRVDDLALALADRAVAQFGTLEMKAVYPEVKPILEPLAHHFLGKIKVPGVARSNRRIGGKKKS